MRTDEPDYARALREADRFLRRWRDAFTCRVREDVAQEAVMESWRRRRTLRDVGCFDACVRTIARRVRYREWKGYGYRRLQSLDTDLRLADALEASEPPPPPMLHVEGEWVERDWLLARLRSALGRLDPLNGHLLQEYYAGASIAELGARHGLSPSCVKARLHRGRARLREDFSARVRRARHEDPGTSDPRPCSFVSTDR